MKPHEHVVRTMKTPTITLWSVLTTQIWDYSCLMLLPAPFTYPNIGIILYGNPQLDKNIYLDIFDAVHNYMISSKRFE